MAWKFLHEGGTINGRCSECERIVGGLAENKAKEEQELAERKKMAEQPGNYSCQGIPGGYTACGPDDFVAAARQLDKSIHSWLKMHSDSSCCKRVM